MAEYVDVFLPMCLYTCGIILLIILIVLGIKLIGILDKVDKFVDNIDEKVNSLNTAFSIIDRTSDGIVSIGNTVLGAFNTLIERLLKKKSKNYNEEND